MAGDDGAEVIGAARITAFAHHRVQPAGRQRRELFQRLADERQQGSIFKRRCGGPCWQTSLGKHPGDGFGMDAQLPGDRSDAPFFNVVIAQDPRLEFRWNSHDRVLLARVAAALGDASGDAETRDEPDPGIRDHTSDSASPLAGAVL